MINNQLKPWCLNIYIAGDNNLSDAGLEDIQELCQIGATENTHVGVEIDTLGEHTGSIRYEITEKDWTGTAHRTVIERLPERDSGHPVTLRDFLRWGSERYPCEKRLVVMWSHGSGFRAPKRDIAYDDCGSSLAMPEIRFSLSQAGFGPNNQIAILGFDACLMSMLEIVNEFIGYVDYVVGSQELEPGDGWPYDQVLGCANRDPAPEELAKSIVEMYIDSYRQIGIGNVTQSAIKVSETDDAVSAWNALGTVLASRLDSEAATMRIVRLRAQSYQMADYVDLIHICDLISEHTDSETVRIAARQAKTAVEGCIVSASHFGPAVKHSRGLSVWFPQSSNLYFSNRGKYLAMRCNEQYSGWVRFLDRFHGAI